MSVPRAMEEGRIQEAEAEKNRLENMQRERRKKAEAMGHEQSPLWFRYVLHCSVGGEKLLSGVSKALAGHDIVSLTCECAQYTIEEMGWKIELRSCVKVEVDVLGSLSLIVCTVSVDVKHHRTGWKQASNLFDLFLHRTLFEGKGRKKEKKRKKIKKKRIGKNTVAPLF